LPILAGGPRRQVAVPLAPELGLFLDKCYYDAYNRKWGNDHEELTIDNYAQEVQRFKVTGRQTDRQGNVQRRGLESRL
jgi:hypothetical protein